jgi:hypothetical protein
MARAVGRVDGEALRGRWRTVDGVRLEIGIGLIDLFCRAATQRRRSTQSWTSTTQTTSCTAASSSRCSTATQVGTASSPSTSSRRHRPVRRFSCRNRSHVRCTPDCCRACAPARHRPLRANCRLLHCIIVSGRVIQMPLPRLNDQRSQCCPPFMRPDDALRVPP